MAREKTLGYRGSRRGGRVLVTIGALLSASAWLVAAQPSVSSAAASGRKTKARQDKKKTRKAEKKEGLSESGAARESPAAEPGTPAESQAPPAESLTAEGQEAEGERPTVRRVAALVVPETEAMAQSAEGVTEMIITALAQRGGFGMVGREEFENALGLEGRHSSLDCAQDPICLGRAATSLGIELILAGSLGQGAENRLVMNINLVDVESFVVRRSIFRKADGPAKLFEAIPAALDELFRPVPLSVLLVNVNVKGARILVDNKEQGRGPRLELRDIKPGSHRIAVSAPGYGDVERNVAIMPGERRTLEVELLPLALSARASSPFYSRWWFWTIVGIAVAGAGTATAIALTREGLPEASLGTYTLP